MKFLCTCGHVISDSTTEIPYKAYFYADQDYDDLCDAIDEQFLKLANAVRQPTASETDVAAALQRAMDTTSAKIGKYARRKIYQCSQCGRLSVDDPQHYGQVFVPEDSATPKNLMRSIAGDQWKGRLRGSWTEWDDGLKIGDVHWETGSEEGYEQHHDFEAFKRCYFEIFARLREKGVLRDAFLSIGDENLHKWP